jgi:hypothetical protein
MCFLDFYSPKAFAALIRAFAALRGRLHASITLPV